MSATVLRHGSPAPAPASAGAGAGPRPWWVLSRWLAAARGIAAWAVSGALLLAALAVVALAALPLFGGRLLVVTSGSMSPTIATGDGAVIVATPPEEIDRGDVIAFHGYGADGLTTHRVVSRHEVSGRPHFRTQGDANPAPDVDLAPADGVVGRVVLRVPQAGRVLAALPSARVQMLVLTAIGALIGVAELRAALRPARPRPGAPAVTRVASRQRALGALDALRTAAGRNWRAVGLAAVVVATAGVSQLVVDSRAVLTASQSVAPNSFATVEVVPPGNVSADFDCGVLGVGKGVIVSWDEAGGADGYEVARATTAGGPYSTVATIGSGSTTRYKDTDVENSTTYHYVVRSTMSSWTSENSAEASETTPGALTCSL